MRTILLALLLIGCTSPDDRVLPTIDPSGAAVDEAPVSATTLRFGPTSNWGDAPFPHSAELGRAPALPAQFPNPRRDEPIFDHIRGTIAERSGFCTTCSIVFGFDGALDVDSLDGRLAIVDLTDGTETPVEYEWRSEEQLLSMRPAHGHALRGDRRYAALVRRGVRGVDGLPVARPASMPPLHGEPELAAYTSFHTDEPSRLIRDVRDAIYVQPPASARLSDAWVGDEVDELLGAVQQTAPGIEIESSDPTEAFAVRHATTHVVVTGTFDAPRFLSGIGDDVGVLRRDDRGAPAATTTEPVPFVLVVPRDADLTNLPVVVMHHGFNASRVTSLLLADTAGAAGWAVLGIDAYQHGDRAAIRSDRRNVFRGIDAADGFPETNKLDIVSRVFGLSGVPTELRLSPEYALGAFTQFAADALSAIRFVREGNLAALREVPVLQALQFDPSRVVFVGNSMGAVVGTAVIAAEPTLAGAVLNVMPGSIVATLAESGEFRPMSERVFLPLLGVDAEFDEVERSMSFDPTVDLFRWVMEPVDPLALAHARVVDNVLVQLAEHDEVAAPEPSASVAAAGAYEQVTVYPAAMHGMLEVVAQESKFQAPLVQPLTRRDEPVMLQNPISAAHDEITDFLLAIDTR